MPSAYIAKPSQGSLLLLLTELHSITRLEEGTYEQAVKSGGATIGLPEGESSSGTPYPD